MLHNLFFKTYSLFFFSDTIEANWRIIGSTEYCRRCSNTPCHRKCSTFIVHFYCCKNILTTYKNESETERRPETSFTGQLRLAKLLTLHTNDRSTRRGNVTGAASMYALGTIPGTLNLNMLQLSDNFETCPWSSYGILSPMRNSDSYSVPLSSVMYKML